MPYEGWMYYPMRIILTAALFLGSVSFSSAVCIIYRCYHTCHPTAAYQFAKKKRWQPLLETDGLGYISTQEHVTPHVGVTARFFGFNSTADEEAFASREIEDPHYE